MNKFNYKKLTPFKWYVLENFPFIEADFDALTEWQLFCKLGKYLNTVINSTNILGTQVQDLTDFVTNYFDNLDVQEEINNKLNEMAESGQLADIIAQYIQLKGILAYNTVNEMKNATNLINGSFAKTYGFHLLNDGGGAFYKIRNITTQDIINEKTIIAINETLIAELIVDDIINVKQIGAYGNNSIDDTETIQFALTNYNNVFLPEGTYLISSSLIIKNYNNIYGSGKKSILKATDEIDLISGNGEATYYCNISNLTIDGNEKTSTNGINLTNVRESFIRNVKIIYCENGIYFYDAWSNSVINCEIYYNTNNINLSNASNDINIFDCKLDLADSYGIVIAGTTANNMINIDGCVFQQEGITAIYCTNTNNINISNCYFENNNKTENLNGYDIFIDNPSVSVVNLSNLNIFFEHSKGGIYIKKAKNIFMNNLYFGRNLTANFNTILFDSNVSVGMIFLFNYGASDNTALTINDPNKLITNFSANPTVFKNSISIIKSYPALNIDSINTGNPEIILLANGDRLVRLYADRTQNIFNIDKKNNNTGNVESVLRINANNNIQPQKDISSDYALRGRIQCKYGASSARPASPVSGEIFFDSTLGKPIFYYGTSWKDANGNNV